MAGTISRMRLASALCLAVALGIGAAGIRIDRQDRESRSAPASLGDGAAATVGDTPRTAMFLAQVRHFGRVAPVFANTLTDDLASLPTARKKTTFLLILLPLVARENARIRAERRLALDPSHEPAPALWRKYKVDPGDREILKQRVDVIPASIVLAQAALESGWGTSRFARQGNNLFGMRTYNPDVPGLTPEDATRFKVVKYANLGASVEHYMRNLNSHPAYRDFRRARADMRAAGDDPDSRHLSRRLDRYSEIPKTYGKVLRQIIDADQLEDFDGVRLTGGLTPDS